MSLKNRVKLTQIASCSFNRLNQRLGTELALSFAEEIVVNGIGPSQSVICGGKALLASALSYINGLLLVLSYAISIS